MSKERKRTMSDNWLEDIMRGNATTPEAAPEKKATATVPRPRPSGMPTHPNEWGSGGKVNLLPGEEEAPASPASDAASSVSANTPEEDGELRKRKEAKKKRPLPPMPKQPPTVHENIASGEPEKEAEGEAGSAGEADGEEAQEAVDEEMKGSIRSALAKARTVTGSAKEKVSEKTKPVKDKVVNEIDPKKAQKWSLLWAGGASWVISPGTLAALYDRAVMLFGSWTESFPRAEFLNSGGMPHEWDLLQGPAWWVRNTVQDAFEAGVTSDLLAALVVGVVPTVALMRVNHRIVRFFLVVGVAYFVGFQWFPQWWEVYMATLAACAYYGWTMANRIQSAFLACMFRVPVAAIVSGSILYSPGAIF